MKNKLLFTILLLCGLFVLYRGGLWLTEYEENSMNPTYRADRLFKPYDARVYHLAQKIERKKPITPDEVKALPKDALNARYGDEITLLFHAAAAYNLQAVDVLLGAGADTTMLDRPSRGRRAAPFVYYLSMPGGSEGTPGDVNFINSLIRLYLKHGGDPNVQLTDPDKPLIVEVATMRNYDGVRILAEAGADVWAPEKDGDYTTAMSVIASGGGASGILNEFIDKGYFDKVPEPALKEFISSIAAYTQRGDKRSLDNQAIGRRVLKRHPEYQEDFWTKLLFQGPIPWKQIQDER